MLGEPSEQARLRQMGFDLLPQLGKFGADALRVGRMGRVPTPEQFLEPGGAGRVDGRVTLAI
jgi:hypothetical protein